MRKEFLPSKQFIVRVIVIIILIAGVFSISKVIKLIKNRNTKDTSIKLVEVIQKVQDDGNNNGIPDWEERLWGLNPNKNGVSNKEFIIAKRKALNPNVDLSIYDKPVSENDTLSRDFFAVVMSLQQTGNLDEEAIQTISNTFSQKIEADPIADIYTKDMIKKISDNLENLSNYYSNLKNLISKYQDKDIGSELGLIVQGIAYNDPQVLYAVKTIAIAYREFGQDLIKIPVPESLSELQLIVANDYEKNAQALYSITQLFDDPIIAMKGIINYKKYNDELATSLELLYYVFETK